MTASPPILPKEQMPTPRTEDEIVASIQEEYLVSFIDGSRHKTLYKHLAKHGMTPDAYLDRFGLPELYPMICWATSVRMDAGTAKRVAARGRQTYRSRIQEFPGARAWLGLEGEMKDLLATFDKLAAK